MDGELAITESPVVAEYVLRKYGTDKGEAACLAAAAAAHRPCLPAWCAWPAALPPFLLPGPRHRCSSLKPDAP